MSQLLTLERSRPKTPEPTVIPEFSRSWMSIRNDGTTIPDTICTALAIAPGDQALLRLQAAGAHSAYVCAATVTDDNSVLFGMDLRRRMGLKSNSNHRRVSVELIGHWPSTLTFDNIETKPWRCL